MKVFIDTNVLVDFVCKREGFFEPAKALFAAAYVGKVKIATLSLSFVNAVYIGRKHGSVVIRERLKRLADFVEVLDLKADTTLWALDCGWTDYEDATQSRTAFVESADCIVTRNKKDFTASSVPVFTVEELLETIW